MGHSTTVHLLQGHTSKLQNIHQMLARLVHKFWYDGKYLCLEGPAAEGGSITEIEGIQ